MFGVDVASIEKLQNPWSRIDHADSFIFSEYPLKFLIYRPDTCQDRMMVMGPDSFVEPLIKLGGGSCTRAKLFRAPKTTKMAD